MEYKLAAFIFIIIKKRKIQVVNNFEVIIFGIVNKYNCGYYSGKMMGKQCCSDGSRKDLLNDKNYKLKRCYMGKL